MWLLAMTLIFYECCIGILFLVDVSEYSAYCRKLQEDEKNIIFGRDVALQRLYRFIRFLMILLGSLRRL